MTPEDRGWVDRGDWFERSLPGGSSTERVYKRGHEPVRFAVNPGTLRIRPAAGSLSAATVAHLPHPSKPQRSYEITLMSAAEREIKREVFIRMSEITERIETGGGLFTMSSRVTDDQAFVALASVVGPASSRERNRVVIDGAELDSFERNREWLYETGEVMVGDWHVHPGGLGTPSETDVRGWRSHLNESTQRWLGVIVTRGQNWAKPRFHGYIVTPGNIVDPAIVN